MAAGRLASSSGDIADRHVIKSGGLSIDESSYTAKLDGRSLELTFKEFELVKFLAQHPGRVFSRQQLLQEVWGYDYFGGTRTVDVHVRRLRAKLGADNETLIGTVRNVGYRFVATADRRQLSGEEDVEDSAPAAVDNVSHLSRLQG
jgi:DNA-binding response OmpR family regulator